MIVKVILVILAIIVIFVIAPCMRMGSHWSRIEEQKELKKFCKEFNYHIVRENGKIVGIIKNSEVDN